MVKPKLTGGRASSEINNRRNGLQKTERVQEYLHRMGQPLQGLGTQPVLPPPPPQLHKTGKTRQTFTSAHADELNQKNNSISSTESVINSKQVDANGKAEKNDDDAHSTKLHQGEAQNGAEMTSRGSSRKEKAKIIFRTLLSSPDGLHNIHDQDSAIHIADDGGKSENTTAAPSVTPDGSTTVLPTEILRARRVRLIMAPDDHSTQAVIEEIYELQPLLVSIGELKTRYKEFNSELFEAMFDPHLEINPPLPNMSPNVTPGSTTSILTKVKRACLKLVTWVEGKIKSDSHKKNCCKLRFWKKNKKRSTTTSKSNQGYRRIQINDS